jgi:hypothetical protein
VTASARFVAMQQHGGSSVGSLRAPIVGGGQAALGPGLRAAPWKIIDGSPWYVGR